MEHRGVRVRSRVRRVRAHEGRRGHDRRRRRAQAHARASLRGRGRARAGRGVAGAQRRRVRGGPLGRWREKRHARRRRESSRARHEPVTERPASPVRGCALRTRREGTRDGHRRRDEDRRVVRGGARRPRARLVRARNREREHRQHHRTGARARGLRGEDASPAAKRARAEVWSGRKSERRECVDGSTRRRVRAFGRRARRDREPRPRHDALRRAGHADAFSAIRAGENTRGDARRRARGGARRAAGQRGDAGRAVRVRARARGRLAERAGGGGVLRSGGVAASRKTPEKRRLDGKGSPAFRRW